MAKKEKKPVGPVEKSETKPEAPKQKDETKIVPVKKTPKDISLFDGPLGEIEELFDGVFDGLKGVFGSLIKPIRTRLPAGFGRVPVDIVDKGKELVVKVAVPGMTKDDVSVFIDGRLLTIEAEKKEEKEKKGKGFYHRQEIHSSLSRTVILPADVKADEANGTIENGVLTLTLPKVSPTKQETKKIEVK